MVVGIVQARQYQVALELDLAGVGTCEGGDGIRGARGQHTPVADRQGRDIRRSVIAGEDAAVEQDQVRGLGDCPDAGACRQTPARTRKPDFHLPMGASCVLSGNLAVGRHSHGRQGGLPAGTEAHGNGLKQDRSGAGFRARADPLKNCLFTVALHKARAYTARPFSPPGNPGRAVAQAASGEVGRPIWLPRPLETSAALHLG